MFEAMVAEIGGCDVVGLDRAALCDTTAGIARVRGALDALEVRVAEAVDDLDDRGGDAESMFRGSGHCSKREAARRARRARKLRDMPNTREQLAKGDLTAEHADALARAAEATSAAEVDGDEGLLGSARSRPADLAAKDIRDWTARRQRNSDREERHRGQVARRSLTIFDGDDDMVVAHCRTDTVSGEQLRARIEDVARRLHREDAGRDDGSSRSWEQLRHDALMLLVGVHGDAGAADRSDARGASPGGAGPNRVASIRNRVIVVVDAATLDGTDPRGRCEIPGVGPLPRSVLDRIACDAEVLGHIFGAHGQPLWHGRGQRTVTEAQWQALVVRDGGCVRCGAQPAHCEAHHMVPWLRFGTTDIDNLVLLCSRDHHEIHDLDLDLVRDPATGRWTATPRAGPARCAA